MKQILYMTRGLPASGKTTWAKEMVVKTHGTYKRVNKDDLRAMIDGGKWSKANEKFILVARDRLIEAALDQGFSVVCDDTNLDSKHEEALRALASLHNADFEIKDFTNVSLEECIQRDQKRPNYVGEKVIRQMHRQYLLKQPERPAWSAFLGQCIICDIDGTLAIKGDRSPYDWHKVGLDTLNDAVYWLLADYEHSDTATILLSGRDECCREETEQWLRANDVPFTALYMRAEGDNRKDNIVKRELYEAHVKGKYNVRFVLDDRDQCIRLWRDELGLPCFQVNYGDF